MDEQEFDGQALSDLIDEIMSSSPEREDYDPEIDKHWSHDAGIKREYVGQLKAERDEARAEVIRLKEENEALRQAQAAYLEERRSLTKRLWGIVEWYAKKHGGDTLGEPAHVLWRYLEYLDEEGK